MLNISTPCISLWQPWASLIAHEFKQFETRSWGTKYRGKLGIHATQFNKSQKQAIVYFQEKGFIPLDIPFGSIICTVDLADCILMTEEFIEQQSETEIECGNWEPGRYAWKLENVKVITPIPAKGKQGFWTFNIEEAKCQLTALPKL